MVRQDTHADRRRGLRVGVRGQSEAFDTRHTTGGGTARAVYTGTASDAEERRGELMLVAGGWPLVAGWR